ncbi:acyl-homoserine lactone acylase PvdQ [Rhizobium binae]|uniref:Acyl-homoserine lactone acylase PvdQ n=1 Tax=Rhizobium binae TaxID=1138190 RepID=A0ABV2MA98_9HYPH|nr:hypothetical protein [Rhizobium binae]MBX4992306.1 hypothetical protein [Rhizobium binae]NKL50727.1 hypothetical protein [Rhizobium leguminosarum bv. viciae]QSY80728.1 hypothetical protein J2J99_13480 [Rhizobium binae]
MSGSDLDRALERAAQANEKMKAEKEAAKADLQAYQNKQATEAANFETFVHKLAKYLAEVAGKLTHAGVPRIELDRPRRVGPPQANLIMKNAIGSTSIVGKLTISGDQLKLKIDLDRHPRKLDLPEIKYPVATLDSEQLVTAMLDAYAKAAS